MSKLTYEDVKKEIEKRGWELVSTSYVNLDSDLDLKCPAGHFNVLSLKQWRHCDCPTCKENLFYNMDTKPVRKKGFRVLGLDQATITSGWAIFDDKDLIKYGKYTTNGSHSTERIAQTKGFIASLIQKWKPSLVALEDIQLQKYGNGEGVLVFKKLAHLQGVLKNYCYECGIPFVVVSSNTWRNVAGIKGRSRTDRKKNAQLLILDNYGVAVSEDEADAVLIAKWAAETQKPNEIINF